MRRFVLIVACATVLSGCTFGGGYDRLTPPLVDMQGVDQARYNADVAECQNKKRTASFVGSANIISDCMEAKGYRIIQKFG